MAQKIPESPQEELKHLNRQRHNVYTEYPPPKHKFHSQTLLYDQPFSRYKLAKNRKYTEWPLNGLKHLTVKRTLYTLITHPEAQISLRFAARPAVLKIHLAEIGNAPNDVRMTSNHLIVKRTLDTLNTYTEALISLRSALRPAVFEIQACRKTEMDTMIPQCP